MAYKFRMIHDHRVQSYYQNSHPGGTTIFGPEREILELQVLIDDEPYYADEKYQGRWKQIGYPKNLEEAKEMATRWVKLRQEPIEFKI